MHDLKPEGFSKKIYLSSPIERGFSYCDMYKTNHKERLKTRCVIVLIMIPGFCLLELRAASSGNLQWLQPGQVLLQVLPAQGLGQPPQGLAFNLITLYHLI
jgi:hypothetical protein